VAFKTARPSAGIASSRAGRHLGAAVLLAAGWPLVAPPHGRAQVTTRVSMASDGTQAFSSEYSSSAISADGRFVAFISASPDLVAGDTNGVEDVFVRDRQAGTTTRVSVRTGGLQSFGPAGGPALSGDGRYVVFESIAGDLVPDDTNAASDIFLHDRLAVTTVRVSVATSGAQGGGASTSATISADGRVVAFVSSARNLVDEDANGDLADVFLRDLDLQRTTRLPPKGRGSRPGGLSLSEDGGRVSVATSSSSVKPTYHVTYLQVHDRATGAMREIEGGIAGMLTGDGTSLVYTTGSSIAAMSVSSGAIEYVRTPGWVNSGSISITANGRVLAFQSDSWDLVHGDTNAAADVFVHDRRVGATWRVSTATDGTQGDGASSFPVLSALGDVIAFSSRSTQLVGGDTNDTMDVFVRELDADRDGLPASWEDTFGLDPLVSTGDDGPHGDPDGDGRSNAQEFQEGTHPRGLHARYFAEGATSSAFETRLALLNTAGVNHVLLRFQSADGTRSATAVSMHGLDRTTIERWTVPGSRLDEFSTVIESDLPLVADRLMRWGPQWRIESELYGSHAETAVTTPRTHWYVAEGSTHGHFALFYLLQNPNAVDVTVNVTYLRPSPSPPLVRAYVVPAHGRFTVWVNAEALAIPDLAGLASTDVSARFEATLPVLVERAMYLDQPGPDGAYGTGDDLVFSAGHDSAAVPGPATQWFLAEGATGPYFDEFILVANPGDADASVQVRYLLGDGRVLTKSYDVRAESRFNIWVNEEEFPGLGKALAEAAVSAVVTSVNDVPIVVERAMWWPRPSPFWMEAHASAGVTATGTTWALAEGESGGAAAHETYILVANTSAFPGTARVTLVYESGGSESVEVPLLPNSRTNVPAAPSWFPAVAGQRFGTLIESLGDTPAQIVVERAMYSDANAVHWAAGSNATGTRLVP
jgi:Tol biopolymer transport system component